MTRTPFGALIIVALATAFAATWPFRGELAQSVAVTTMARPLAYATSWRFVPDAADVGALDGDRSDIVVTGDRTIDGRDLTFDDVASLQSRGGAGARLVLAYFNIADVGPKASTWDQAWSIRRPSWSDGDNCVVKGGMRVDFWDADWKAIVFRRAGSLLDRVIASGFDGVYVGGLQRLPHVQKQADTLRIEATRYITELAAVARKKKAGFVLMADGDAALLSNPEFRDALDGVGVDGLLYGAKGDVRRPISEIRATYDSLRPLQAEGKPVFAVERSDTADVVQRSAQELRRRGIVPAFEPAVPNVDEHCAR